MGNLYDTILTLCESRGIKGGKMCSDIGISKGLLTDLKMGRRTGVSAVTAQKIATYFDVSVGYLLGEEEMGIKKEQPTEINGLSDELVELIGVLKELPKDKILALLQLAKSMK